VSPIGQKLLLIAALNDVDENQHDDDKIECTFGHRLDLVAEQLQLGQVRALPNSEPLKMG